MGPAARSWSGSGGFTTDRRNDVSVLLELQPKQAVRRPQIKGDLIKRHVDWNAAIGQAKAGEQNDSDLARPETGEHLGWRSYHASF